MAQAMPMAVVQHATLLARAVELREVVLHGRDLEAGLAQNLVGPLNLLDVVVLA